MQVVFRLPVHLREQSVLYNLEEGGYVPLEPPQALVADQLAMLLPAAVAMQARLSPWKCCPLRDLGSYSLRTFMPPHVITTSIPLQCHTSRKGRDALNEVPERDGPDVGPAQHTWQGLGGRPCVQMISLRPVGTCLNDTRANVGLQRAQAGQAMSRRSQLPPAKDASGFKNTQVNSYALCLSCEEKANMLHTIKAPHLLPETPKMICI